MTTQSSPTQTHDTGAHDTETAPALASGPARAAKVGYAAKGVLLGAVGELVIFRPLDTSYDHHLEVEGGASGFLQRHEKVVGRNVRGIIHVTGRKLYSVASGGNFVQPILGTPRIIQGRVLGLEGNTLYVKAAAVFAVELPTGKDAIDLDRGPLAVNTMVNVVALPGARLELVQG